MMIMERVTVWVLVLLELSALVLGAEEMTDLQQQVLRGTTSNEQRDLDASCTAPRILLKSGQILSVGEEWNSWDTGKHATIKQEANGNMVIRRRFDGKILCQSGANEPSDGVPYITKLYGDGNLITWRSPERIPPRVWKSNRTGDPTATWFLAVNCDDSVSIYRDNVFGEHLWTCPGSENNNAEITEPTPSPVQPPTPQWEPEPTYVTTFCVVADAPYRYEENIKLLNHVENLHPECEFLAHLGDIRSARLRDDCVWETYRNASIIMRQSPKPVFMMIGDNEWNDCRNPDQGLRWWHDEFDNFHSVHWKHDFNVTSQPGRIENMYFVHNKALFIMLNIVGGQINDRTEWDTRLSSNFLWTKSLIEEHVRGTQPDANVVVVMAHAQGSSSHRNFFHGMRDYIEFDLQNSIPIVYLNGDAHSWNEQAFFYEQSNWKRITLEGNARDKPLMVTVNAADGVNSVDDAFSFRQYY